MLQRYTNSLPLVTALLPAACASQAERQAGIARDERKAAERCATVPEPAGRPGPHVGHVAPRRRLRAGVHAQLASPCQLILDKLLCFDGERFRIPLPQGRVGSSPTLGMMLRCAGDGGRLGRLHGRSCVGTCEVHVRRGGRTPHPGPLFGKLAPRGRREPHLIHATHHPRTLEPRALRSRGRPEQTMADTRVCSRWRVRAASSATGL